MLRVRRLYETLCRGPTLESPSNVAPMFLVVSRVVFVSPVSPFQPRKVPLNVSCPHETKWSLDLSRNSFDESIIP